MNMRKPKIIFTKLGLENFGSFYKYNEINFSTNKNKNVTLITGKIGSGKTTIFQLFWWVLFPEEREEGKSNEIKFFRHKEVIEIVNNLAIKNARVGDIITVKGYISFNWISTSGNSIQYAITRKRSYRKKQESELLDEVQSDKKQTLEFVRNSDKVIVEKNGVEVRFSEYLYLINEIFPPAIRNFAFIHGEGMTRILSIENIGELKSSVLTISDHPKVKGLELYIKACKTYFDKKRKDWNKDNAKLQQKRKDIDVEKVILEDLIKDNDENENKINTYYDRIAELEDELGELKKNQVKIKDYNRFKENISELKNRKYGKIDVKSKSRKKGIIQEREEKLLRYAPILYLEEAIDLCLSDIQEKRKMGLIPGTSIPQLYLKMIIEREEGCVCGTTWDEKMKNDINKLISHSQDNKVIEVLNIFEGYLKEQKKRINEGREEITRIQSELWDINDKIKEQEEEILKFERTLSDEEKERDSFIKIQELEESKDNLNRKYGNIEGKIKRIKNEIEIQSEKVDKLNSDYNKLETTKTRNRGGRDAFYYKNIYERLNNIEELRKILTDIIGNRIKEETQEETEYILVQLVKDPDEWQEITINDKGSGWEINAKFQDTIVKNTSTGMTNVLGLSFIFALSHILGVDLPLIFDSPLGNLDSETRELIVENLPPIFKGRQIIFFEKKANFTVSKEDSDEIIKLYPILKKYIDYEYLITNPNKINSQIKEIR